MEVYYFAFYVVCVYIMLKLFQKLTHVLFYLCVADKDVFSLALYHFKNGLL